MHQRANKYAGSSWLTLDLSIRGSTVPMIDTDPTKATTKDFNWVCVRSTVFWQFKVYYVPKSLRNGRVSFWSYDIDRDRIYPFLYGLYQTRDRECQRGFNGVVSAIGAVIYGNMNNRSWARIIEMQSCLFWFCDVGKIFWMVDYNLVIYAHRMLDT